METYAEVKKAMAFLADLERRIDSARCDLKKLEKEKLDLWFEMENWFRGELLHRQQLLRPLGVPSGKSHE